MYQAGSSFRSDRKDSVFTRWAAGFRLQGTIGRRILSDPEGSSVRVDGLEVYGAGRASSDCTERERSGVVIVTSFDGATESQGKESTEESYGGLHGDESGELCRWLCASVSVRIELERWVESVVERANGIEK